MRYFTSLFPLLGVLGLSLLIWSDSYGQASGYTYATATGQSLVTMSSPTTATTVANGSLDDGNNILTLPFTFTFNGVSYTQITVITNGYLIFGTSASSTAVTVALFSGTSGSPAVSAWGRDGNLNTANGGNLQHGAATGDLYVVQFTKLSGGASGATSSTIHLTTQIVLYGPASTNPGRISILYGTSAGTSASAAQVGIRDVAGTFINGLSGSTSSTTTTATYPASGVAYTFTPPPPCVAPTNLAATATATSTGTATASGSFTAAAVAPTGYLVVRTATNTQPAPVNGTTYTIGSNAIGQIEYAGTSAGSWSSSGLTGSTQYYYWVFSYNSAACSGGPVYSLTAQTATATTAACSGPGTYTVGPTGTFPTLTAAFATLAGCTPLTGAYVLELQSTYTSASETFPLTVPAYAGASATNTLTVRPAAGATGLVLTSANTTATLNLNGAQYVVLDGRPGGSGASQLTVANTSTATGGTAVQLINEASNNTLRYVTLTAVFASGTSGVVNVMGTSGSNGNDNNTIEYCDIDGGAAAAASPTATARNGIYASGNTSTTAANNSNNTIANCNIFNVFAAASASNGILISGGNTDWTISTNRFYQTASRTQTTSAQHSGISISNTSGNNFLITGNTIGFANAAGTGTYTLAGLASTMFIPINLSVGTTTATSVQGNTIAGIAQSGSSSGTTSSAPFRGIYVASGLTTIGNVSGNIIGSISATGSITYTSSSSSASDVVGILNWGSSNWTTSNNQIGGITAANSSTGAANIYGIRCNTSSSVTWVCNNNTIGGTIANSIASTSTATGTVVNGILNSAPAMTCTGNTIRNLSVAGGTGTGTSAALIGISVNATSANHTLSQNTIHTLSSSLAGAAVVSGINYSSSSGANLVERNLIYNLDAAAATATVNGINITGGTTTFRNNMIRLGTTGNSATTGLILCGINETVAGTDNFYHNSVYIGGAPTAGASNSFALQSTITTNTRAYQNNILVNARSNSGSTGKHYALRLGGIAANPAGLTSNYNDLLATGTGGFLGLFNGVDQATMAAWRTATGQDANSISADPQFIASTAATPDLHIHPTNITPIEASGTLIASVTDDFDGQTRSGFTPTDMGADAGDFTGQDIQAPVISGVAIGGSFCDLTSRTVTATLTDLTGMPTTGALQPRLYYRVSTGAYTSVQGTLASGTATNGTWSFVMDLTAVSAAAGNTIQYYVIAQDASPANNLTSSPAGVVATDVNTVTTAPGSPLSYLVGQSLSGTYTVGGGGNFATLTAAATAYNTGCATGPVVFSLTDNSYSASETFPITLNGIATASAVNTLTIQPSATATPTILGLTGSTAVLVLDGADYVTIDGRQGGTGSTKTLVISGANTSGTTVSLVNDATNNTLKYIVVQGITTSTSSGVVFIGTTTGTNGNDNTTIDRCDIRDGATFPSYGIYATGNTTSTAHNNSGITVSNNNIFNYFNASGASGGVKVQSGNTDWTITGNSFYQTGTRAVSAGGATVFAIDLSTSGNNFVVSGNAIGGNAPNAAGTSVYTSSNNTRYRGISLSVGATTASSIQGNTISGWDVQSSSGATTLPGVFCGIYLTAGNANIGTASGNTIGSASGTSSIKVTTSNTSNAALSAGIGSDASSTVSAISNNVIAGIETAGATAAVSHSFTGILTTAGTTLTISNNTLGSTSVANSLYASTASTSTNTQVLAGILNSSSATITLSGNTVANLNNAYVPSSATTGSVVRGIVSTSGVATITGNVVQGLTTAANATGSGTSAAVLGIGCSSSTTGQTVSQNTISGLSATNTGANSISVIGIAASSATTGSVNLISRNRVSGVTNTATGTTSFAAGLWVSSGNWTVANNMISVTNGANTNGMQCAGIFDNGSATNAYYHNTVYVGGSQNATALNSVAFQRASSATVTLRNNLFDMQRTGTGASTGKFYAIANTNTTPATGWSGTASNNNLLNASSAATVGIWGTTDVTFGAWQSSSGGDGTSYTSGALSYVNAATGDLHLNTGATPTPAESGGTTSGVSITDDFDAAGIRTGYPLGGQVNGGGTAPDLGADEFDGAPVSPCITPVAPATALVLTPSTTSVGISFTPSGSATGYLVVRTDGTTPANPVDGTSYTAGATALGGVIVAYGATVTGITSSGLSGGTLYAYSVFAFNAGTCIGGPVYLTATVLSGTTTTCPDAPVVAAATAVGVNGFTANWAAVPGATGYQVDVSASATFATFVTGYNSLAVTGTSVSVTGLTGNVPYYYRVRTVANCVSISSTPQTVCLTYGVPYAENFNSVTAPAIPSCATVINAGSGNIWTTATAPTGYTGNVLQYAFNAAFAANTWFFTPGLSLTGGVTYTLSYVYGNASTTYAEKLKVAYGTAATAAAMTTQLKDYPLINTNTATTDNVTFTPGTSGVYYLGFQAYSDADEYYLYVDNISLQGPCVAPDPVSGLTFDPPSPGSLNGSFTAPASGASGYLVVRYPSGATPTAPSAGPLYLAGQSLGAGTIVSSGTSTSFQINSLAPATAYDIYVYAYNNTSCTGGPAYSIATMSAQTTAACPVLGALIRVGQSQAYVNLYGVSLILNGCPISQPTLVELQSDYDAGAETFPIIFTGNPGANSTNTITIVPRSGMGSILWSSPDPSPMLRFNGAHHYILEGRAGGTGSAVMSFIHEDNQPAMLFENDAQNITISYVSVSSFNTTATSGVIKIGTAAGTTATNGNNSLVFDHCDINGNGVSPNGIYAQGSPAPADNKSITISNNNIYDYFQDVAGRNAGIQISTHNAVSAGGGWTITGNNFYQTVSRTYANAVGHGAINADGSAGGVFTITNNAIGGTAPACAGTPMTFTGAGAHAFAAIRLFPASTAITTVSGNTVQNISLTTAVTTTTTTYGIGVQSGQAVITGNTIGSAATAGSITFSGAASGGMAGIITGNGTSASGTTLNTTNNTIAGIALTGVNSNNFTGINYVNTTTLAGVSSITGNTLGTASAPITNATPGSLTGIAQSNVIGSTIQGNTLAYFTSTSTGTGSQVRGIVASAGPNAIGGAGTGNTLSNFTTSAPNTGTTTSASVLGIALTATATTGQSVTGNTVSALTNSANASVVIAGIYWAGPASGTNTISANKVYGLSASNTAATGSVVNGVHVNGGPVSVFNNVVRLGTVNPTVPSILNGINDASGANTYSYNSVYIGGSGVVTGSSNTFAFTSSPSTGTRAFRNNIFVNARSNGTSTGEHYAIQVGGSSTAPSGLTLNNNLYFVSGTGGVLGRFNSTDVISLADWKTTTYASGKGPGLDAFSYSTDPNFIDPVAAVPNLSVSLVISSPAEGGGVQISGITTDIAGVIRAGNPGYAGTGGLPDIGAYEIEGITALPVISGVSITPASCTAIAHAVSATITSGTVVSSANVTYSLNGVAQTPVAMTNPSGNTWTASIPAATNVPVTWGISVQNAASFGAAYTGTAYTDDPLNGVNALSTASAGVVCSGGNITLSSSLNSLAAFTGYAAPTAVSNPTTDEDLGNVTLSQGATTILSNTSARNVLTGSVGTATGTAGSFANYTAFGPYGLTAGQAYSFSLTSLDAGSAYGHSMAIFIDYNRDGDYADAGETVYAATVEISGAHTETGTFTVPASAFNGLTRMRVICSEDLITAATNVVGYGEFEEYMLSISGGTTGGGATPPAITSIAWTLGGSPVGTGNPLAVTPLNATASPVVNGYVAAITSQGCVVNATPVNVTVNPLPSVPTANPSIQCGTSTPLCSVTSTSGAGTPVFTWYTALSGGTVLAGQTASSLSAYPISSTSSFYVTEVSGDGCESTPRTTLTATVTTTDPLTASATPMANACTNQPVALSVSQTGSTQNYALTWTASPAAGSGIPVSTGGSLALATNVAPTAAGTYTYTITGVDGGCTAVATVNVTVSTSPPTPAILSTSFGPVCSGSVATLTAANNLLLSTVTLGTGTGTNSASSTGNAGYPAPFGAYYENSRQQYLIQASELSALGMVAGSQISSIGFSVATLGTSGIHKSYTLAMGNTAQTAIATFESGLTTVYGPADYQPISGVNTFTFSAPFVWNGTSNIVVQVCHTNDATAGGTNFTANAQTTLSTTAFNSSLTFRRDDAAACGANTITYTEAERPNMIFGATVPSPGVWAPVTDLYTDAGGTIAYTGTNTNAVYSKPVANRNYTITLTAANGCAVTSATAPVTVTSVLPDNDVLATSGTALTADAECTDGTGWTHYYVTATNDRVLSVKKNGNDIGTIGAGGFSVSASTTPAYGSNAGTAINPATAPYVQVAGWVVMNRWWNVANAAQPTTDVQVRTYFTAQDVADVNGSIPGTINDVSKSQLVFYKINGGFDPNPVNGHAGIARAANYAGSGYWEYNPGVAASSSSWRLDSLLAAGPYYGEYTVASFSGGGGGGSEGGGGAFPVEWLSVNAEWAGNDALISWTTGSELNNALFTVERSLGDGTWLDVASTPGAGTSNGIETYSLKDTDAALALSALQQSFIYRIRQTDFNGSVSYSESVELTRTITGGSVMVYPNPVRDLITVALAGTALSGSNTFTVFDMAGRKVTEMPLNQAATQIDLSGMAAGTYYYRVHDGTAVIASGQLFRQ